jgi:hypothetical protein
LENRLKIKNHNSIVYYLEKYIQKEASHCFIFTFTERLKGMRPKKQQEMGSQTHGRG